MLSSEIMCWVKHVENCEIYRILHNRYRILVVYVLSTFSRAFWRIVTMSHMTTSRNQNVIDWTIEELTNADRKYKRHRKRIFIFMLGMYLCLSIEKEKKSIK